MLAVSVTAVPVCARAQDAASALARAEAAYSRLRTVQAEFIQVIDNPMLGDPDTSSGRLFLIRPDRFAMRFTDPSGDRVVADGEWLWIFTPSTVEDQVIRRPIPSEGATTPNLFAQFVENASERYRARYRGLDTLSGEPVDLVNLIPTTEVGFTEATIAVSRETGVLRRVRFREESGQWRTITLSSVAVNGPVDDAEVSFTVPRGIRVVTP